MDRLTIEQMTVAEILNRWPHTASVFIARKMACPGCAISLFMTPREVCGGYEIDADGLIQAVCDAIGTGSMENEQ